MATFAAQTVRRSTYSSAQRARHFATAAASIATHQGAGRCVSKVSIPPGFVATVGNFETFVLPDKILGTLSDTIMAKAMINAWRKDGILQIAMSPWQERLFSQASKASKKFFQKTPAQKHACVNDSSFCGYIASGEEITSGIADYSEIFTVSKNLQPEDHRVLAEWPFHGPCPWPDKLMERDIMDYVSELGSNGEKLLQMIELGLDVPPGSLTKYTQDGWHHMRALRFPSRDRTNGKGAAGRGIGSHTDYGLLVMAAQDEVGGDMMQHVTNSFLRSTPHKVGLNVRERFAFAYFHEPNFKAVVKPLPGFDEGQKPAGGIHYGTYFTKMTLQNYPDRISTRKLLDEGRCSMLEQDELRSDMAA
ncbi:hypothetical protein EsDP_00001202 [Epichloe bromicola]|uniref:Non-haem dioxygenase N-terminal domain-containing protein n=1 Tax=Epichloe bromicola TaxID=79588 RepID=A0ABQ0CH57_9HYPO